MLEENWILYAGTRLLLVKQWCTDFFVGLGLNKLDVFSKARFAHLLGFDDSTAEIHHLRLVLPPLFCATGSNRRGDSRGLPLQLLTTN